MLFEASTASLTGHLEVVETESVAGGYGWREGVNWSHPVGHLRKPYRLLQRFLEEIISQIECDERRDRLVRNVEKQYHAGFSTYYPSSDELNLDSHNHHRAVQWRRSGMSPVAAEKAPQMTNDQGCCYYQPLLRRS